jgi:Ca-activated chloride channel family protein
MRKHQIPSSVVLIIVATLITLVPCAQAQSKATDCGTQQRKELVLTAVDKNGSVVESLRAEHLTLKVGSSDAAISDVVFRNNDRPLDLVVLIDSSISQEKVLPVSKAAAQSFITSVVTAGRDRVAVLSFSNEPNNKPVLTSDLAVAAASIEQIKINIPPGYIGGGMVVSATRPTNPNVLGSTSLWDVIGSTAQALFGDKAESRRRVMLLFTDGNDTSSSSKLNAAIEDAVKHDMTIFSIGLADPIFGASESTLKKLSEQTGGVASFPKKKDAVESALMDVAKRVRANYVMGYCGDPNRAKLQVEVTDPEIRKTKPVLAYKRF